MKVNGLGEFMLRDREAVDELRVKGNQKMKDESRITRVKGGSRGRDKTERTLTKPRHICTSLETYRVRLQLKGKI